MRLSRFTYSLLEGMRGIKRNGLMGLVCITTVTLCLTIFGLFVLLTANLSFVTRDLESQIEIAAYLKNDVTSAKALEIKQAVFEIDGVDKVDYVSKEDALKRLRERFGTHSFLLAGLEERNPLPASLEIRVKDPAKIPQVAGAVGQIAGVEEVDYRQDLVNRLLAVTRILRLGGAVLVAGLAVATVMLISNTIRLTVFARRKEIGIMKLVGATDSLVSGPFLAEGLLIGFSGAAIAALISGVIYRWASKSIVFALPFIPVLQPYPLVRDMSVGMVLLGTTIGAVGSWLSMRKYLRA